MNYLNKQSERRLDIFVYTTISLTYILFAVSLPLYLAEYNIHDDAWYIRNAESIVSGHWLGGFNQMALIKGPGYSYFLALNYLLGVPVTLSTAWLYLSACTLLVRVARQLGMQKPLAWALFVFLLFQPAEFSLRIVRDDIYTSLTMIALSGWAYLTLGSEKESPKLLLAITGFAAGLYWITREEGVWILPGILVLGLCGAIMRFRRGGSLFSLSMGAAIYLASGVIPILATALMNYAAYGAFQIVDLKSSAFMRAMNALNSVNVGDEIQFVPVPQKKREAIYKISPAFNELYSYLEKDGKHWANLVCGEYKSTCGDYSGGFFVWALRDGLASLGYYSSPQAAERYYNRLSDEIELACADGRLSCSKSPIGLMPRVAPGTFQAVPATISEAFRLSTYRIPMIDFASSPASPHRAETVNFLGNPRILPAADFISLVANGWYYSPAGNWIEIVCNSRSGDEHIPVVRRASPGIADYFHDASAVETRFAIELADHEKCVIRSSDGIGKDLPLANIQETAQVVSRIGNGTIHFDNIKEERSYHVPLKIKSKLITIYKFSSIYIFAIGVVAFFASLTNLVLKKTRFEPLIGLSASLWVLYISRLSLLVLISVTSFPAVKTIYMMPAFPIWSAAAFVSVSALWKQLRMPALGRTDLTDFS